MAQVIGKAPFEEARQATTARGGVREYPCEGGIGVEGERKGLNRLETITR